MLSGESGGSRNDQHLITGGGEEADPSGIGHRRAHISSGQYTVCLNS